MNIIMEIAMEYAAQILGYLVVALLGVLGTWLTAKFAKRQNLINISIASNEAVAAAQQTVLELQQTLVDGWKAASADGKLTEEEIKDLSVMLVEKTLEKMSVPAVKLLRAAGADLVSIITGAGEAMLQNMKQIPK